ncbi:MAG: hypothetical protein M3Y41_19180 [Pseudomonadota bacterium]|nr:hypothetical protein [Pseudomonadota bacterium]
MAATVIGSFFMASSAMADGTSRALTEFDWAGTWSQDCSVPYGNEDGTHPKRILARIHHSIPVLFGKPTSVVELNVNGHFEQTFTVLSAVP